MTDNNHRPWRDRITTRTGPNEPLWLDDVTPIAAHAPALRGLLGEAHDLAAEVEQLRALLATPTNGPLRVERQPRSIAECPHLLYMGDRFVHALTDAEADAIEAQLATPGNAHPDLVDGTNLTRRWLAGDPVDAVGLAAELRQWADTFQPTDLLRRKPQTVTVELPKDVAERLAGAHPRPWGDLDAMIDACREALGR